MQLSKSSKIVRWAYFTVGRPKWTSLCSIFWLSMVVTPIAVVIMGLLLPIWGPIELWEKYCQKRWRAWRAYREDLAYERQRAAYEREVVERRLKLANPPEPSAWQVLWQGAKAIKNKVCPIVEIVD